MMYGNCGVGVDDMDEADNPNLMLSDWSPIDEFPFRDATVAKLVSGSSDSEGDLPAVDDSDSSEVSYG